MVNRMHILTCTHTGCDEQYLCSNEEWENEGWKDIADEFVCPEHAGNPMVVGEIKDLD